MTEGPLCARCCASAPLFPANCNEKPELLGTDSPIGMYHCPDCGAMVLAGIPHGELCQLCIDRNHPLFDKVGLSFSQRADEFWEGMRK